MAKLVYPINLSSLNAILKFLRLNVVDPLEVSNPFQNIG